MATRHARLKKGLREKVLYKIHLLKTRLKGLRRERKQGRALDELEEHTS